MVNRKLVLRREALMPLLPGEMQVVAGAASSPSCTGTCIEPRCFVMPDTLQSVRESCVRTLCICPE